MPKRDEEMTMQGMENPMVREQGDPPRQGAYAEPFPKGAGVSEINGGWSCS